MEGIPKLLSVTQAAARLAEWRDRSCSSGRIRQFIHEGRIAANWNAVHEAYEIEEEVLKDFFENDLSQRNPKGGTAKGRRRKLQDDRLATMAEKEKQARQRERKKNNDDL